MTVRYVSGSDPKRIVLASRLDIPTTARLFAKGPGLLLIGTNGVDRERVVAMRQAGAEVRLVNAEPDGNVSLGDALEVIASWGVRRLLVEGGARVLSSFLQQRLADRVVVEIVPKFLGAAGIACTSHLFVGRIDESPGLTEVSVENIGSSFVLRGRVARQGALLESASFAVGREQSSVSA
jgi:riboflavin biosynthesis pyrimidine reductase